MRLKTVYIFLYALLGLFLPTGKADTIINFTEKQKLWLQQHGPVTMCVDPDWEPFESIDENGKHVGIAADLLELISLRSGVIFQLVITENWEQSLEYSKQGKCQVLSFLNSTPQREEWLIFTDPYFSEHNVFITREEHDFISDPARLSNHSMVLPRGTSIEERIRNDYPNLELILVESESDAMKMVDKKKADMTMRSLSMAAYTIKKEGYFNLKIAGRLPRYSNQLSMGISSDLPLLKDILNPAIATITPQEIEQATHNHISINIVSPPNYKVIMAVAAALMLILMVGLAWNYQLRRLNARLSEKQGRLIELSKKLKEDIEIRREAEEASRGNAARYKAFIAASNAGAWEYNYGTGHLWCSPNYFAMLGRDSKDFDLQSPDNAFTIWNELLHPDDREQVFAHLHHFMENREETYESTFRMLDANGNDFWVLSRGKLLTDNTGKKPPVIIGTHMDINNQKKAEELIKTKNKELETFLYVTSHDLRSPLINIQGFSHKIEKQFLKLKAMVPAIQTQGEESDSLEQILNKNIPGSLAYIYSNVDKMNNLIDGLLTISRVGRVKLNIAECKMDKLINHIHINLGIQIEQSYAHINASSLPDCFGDEDLLNQVFTNLIDNAIKYQKPDTTPEISITGRKEKSSVTYTITDNGIGISEDHLPRIWDVFFRADTSSAQKGEGIGLSLVKIIVEKHHGKIWAESREGEGSTFFVQLPVEKFSA